MLVPPFADSQLSFLVSFRDRPITFCFSCLVKRIVHECTRAAICFVPKAVSLDASDNLAFNARRKQYGF
jgi:hypothetical protein